MQIITAYNNYIFNRGLSEEICHLYGLNWGDSGKLIIPVKNIEGTVLFNKYRRNPLIESGPKYTYDSGSKSSVFGLQMLTRYKEAKVIICEGELDAVMVTDKMSPEFVGISSTGGCGTWNLEWNVYLENRQVFVCYDTDGPGVLGSLRVHQKIPDSKLMFLPQNLRLNPKDITELYQKSPSQFKETIYKMEREAEHIEKFTTDSILEKEKKILQDYWLDKKKNFDKEKKDNYWVKIILEHVNNLHIHKQIKKTKIEGTDVEKAKATPIPNLIKFRQNKSKCIWHDDSTPSMTYYPETNTVHCFGCRKNGDAIDVYMQLHGLTFKQAINRLNNKEENA